MQRKDTRVELAREALLVMCYYAKAGYETLGKREQLGLLFGRVQGGTALVRHAVLYRARKRARTGVEFDIPSIVRRREELARRLRLRYLGMFHTHVEIAGEVAVGLSDDDIRSFAEDDGSAIEVLVAVRAVERRPLGKSPRVLTGYEEKTGYAYTVRAYGKSDGGVRLLRIRRGKAAPR